MKKIFKKFEIFSEKNLEILTQNIKEEKQKTIFNNSLNHKYYELFPKWIFSFGSAGIQLFIY